MPLAPLTNLTKQDRSFNWTSECEQAFQTLKTLNSAAPVLKYLQFDREFIVQTDASDVGVGAVLSQLDDGIEKPVAFASQSLSARKCNIIPQLRKKRMPLFTPRGTLEFIYSADSSN